MKTTIWLKITARKKYASWEAGAIHAYKTKPDTGKNTIAMQVTLDIPDAVFETPQFRATLAISDKSVSGPIVEASVASNIAEILSQQLGITVHVTAEDQKLGEQAPGNG